MIMVLVLRVDLAFPQASVSTAEIRGQVIDEKGAVIAGATITLTDVTKGTARQVTSDENGNYVFLSLLPSDYSMKVEATGFATKTLTNIHLDVGQVANIPVTLSVGGLQAEINVTATTDVVEV
ncbi:MAG TPA: carboxypeptidase-like regulatory domain-containing protein, partial [Blastocatellia bacterium]|nr:carboxypeptidase-like regulatory domain-containing protein [Blastocatellia bacterium]